jgi:acyl carrier protein
MVSEVSRLDILAPDDIADDAPLSGGSLDLDSFDRLELALCIEETFGIAAGRDEASRIDGGSIAGLADVLLARLQAARAPRLPMAGRAAARTAALVPLRFAPGAPA